MEKRRIVIFIGIIAGLFLLNHQATWALEKKIFSLSQKGEEKVEMKVNFYAIDRKKAAKGEFIGTVEFKEGKLEVNVVDNKLERILKEPYTTMTGEIIEGKAYDRFITYQPGTKEHLQSIAIECYKFGYIGEVVAK